MNNFNAEKETNDKKALDNFDLKIIRTVVESIGDVEAHTKEEEAKKLEYQMNLCKILEHYEELRPIFSKYFDFRKKNNSEEEKSDDVGIEID